MRETDSRMAKYSRRGLIFNFIAFLICLFGGKFVDENRELTVILLTGLLLVTFLRGFYLFRFDQHYPRGPARWRNVYFVVTLIGAMWWGVILASITLVLGLEDEAPLLWLYTVVFFSTTAHAFAPYHRFLAYYQFFGLIPAAGAAIWIGGWSGHIYGVLMLMFYLILSHQCRLISDNYWEKLEAGYALSKRSNKNESAHADSQSGLQLSREFVSNLEMKIEQFIRSKTNVDDEQAGGLSELHEIKNNIGLFKELQNRELSVTHRVFNVRHELQSIASEFVEMAESQGIQIETSLSSNLPMRLKGDPTRFAQIIRTILHHSLDSGLSKALIIEAQFLREFEAAGELHIAITRDKQKTSAIPFFTDSEQRSFPQSIELSIAKGMAELFGGELELVETVDKDYEIRINCRLDIVDRSGQLDFHKDRFNGSRILMVTSSSEIAVIKRLELDALGFTVSTETQFKRVSNTLIQQIKSGNAVENVLIYHDPSDESCTRLLNDLRNTDELKGLNKIVAASESSQKLLMSEGFDQECGFYFVSKPLGLFELESTFDYMYSSKGDEASLRLCRNGSVVIVGEPDKLDSVSLNCDQLPNQRVIKCRPDELEKTLAVAYHIMVVVPCTANENPIELIEKVRAFEAQHEEEDVFIPIIGIGENGCSCQQIGAFELGFDDFIDMDSYRAKTLTSTLRYWRSIDQ